jgi:hypothetical protein
MGDIFLLGNIPDHRSENDDQTKGIEDTSYFTPWQHKIFSTTLPTINHPTRNNAALERFISLWPMLMVATLLLCIFFRSRSLRKRPVVIEVHSNRRA